MTPIRRTMRQTAGKVSAYTSSNGGHTNSGRATRTEPCSLDASGSLSRAPETLELEAREVTRRRVPRGLFAARYPAQWMSGARAVRETTNIFQGCPRNYPKLRHFLRQNGQRVRLLC